MTTLPAVYLARHGETAWTVSKQHTGSRTDLLAGTNLVGHTFNFFSPWQINEDGTEAETLNHIGRQEFGIYSDPSFNDDPNLTYLPGGTHASSR